MTKNDFEKWYKNYHKGTYVSVVKEHELNGYVKQVKLTTRFINYYEMQQVKAKGTSEGKTRDYEEQIIPHVLKLNTNTNNLLLMVYDTNHHKHHTHYTYKGIPITKEQYYEGTQEKQKTYAKGLVETWKLSEIVSIGGVC